MKMNISSNKSINVFVILSIMCVTLLVMFSASLSGEERYVTVTMKDNSVIKYHYDGFTLHWLAPQIKDEATCEYYDFDMSDITEVYVLNTTLNKCDQREDEWIFDVYLKDREPVQGFILVTQENITGSLYDTNEEKTIPFTEISKITYH